MKPIMMDGEVIRMASNRAEPADSHWSRRLAWLSLFIVSWAVFELTASGALAIIVLCGKFGWNDAQTAFWLRKTDPDKTRGKVCGWFYLASSLWKVSLAAVAAMFATTFLALAIDAGRGGDAPAEFIAATLLALIASGISSLATWFAVASARRNAVKVWVEPAVHRARRAGVWPPHQFCRANQAGYLLIVAIIYTAAPLLAFLLTAGFLLVEAVGKHAPLIIAIATGWGVIAPIVMLVAALKERIARAVIAIVPEECWGGRGLTH